MPNLNSAENTGLLIASGFQYYQHNDTWVRICDRLEQQLSSHRIRFGGEDVPALIARLDAERDRKVAYIVTAGEYSDYGIKAVFLNLESAECWIASQPNPKYASDSHQIETFTVNP